MFWRKSKLIKKQKKEIEDDKMIMQGLNDTINSYITEKNSLKGQLRVAKSNNTKLITENNKLKNKIIDLENNIELLMADRESTMKKEITKKTTARKRATKKETTSKNTTSKK